MLLTGVSVLDIKRIDLKLKRSCSLYCIQFCNVGDSIDYIVEDVKNKAAKVIVGGTPANGELFYEPMLMGDFKEDMLVYRAEVFDSAAAIINF
ncbi:hypothetical protein Trydic_g1202 [Trypoxylus dichotomus]